MAGGHLAVAALLSAIALAGCSSVGDADTVDDPPSDLPAPSTTPAVSPPDPTTSQTPPALPSDLVFQGYGIRIQPSDGSGPRYLVIDGPADQEHPDWSPDGSRVVFDAGFSTLWTVRSDGDGLEQVYKCVEPCYTIQDPAWSPDGRSIAFMEGTSDGKSTTSGKIQILAIDTKTVRTVYEDTTGTGFVFAPRWSPDGRSIVFEQDTYATKSLSESKLVRARIGVIDLDGATKPRFIVSGTDQLPASPDWSPAGDVLVFSMGDNLVTVRPDGSQQHFITDYDGQTEHAIQPTFAPSGHLIVFTYVTGTFGVDDKPSAAIVDLTGADLQILVAGATHPRLKP